MTTRKQISNSERICITWSKIENPKNNKNILFTYKLTCKFPTCVTVRGALIHSRVARGSRCDGSTEMATGLHSLRLYTHGVMPTAYRLVLRFYAAPRVGVRRLRPTACYDYCVYWLGILNALSKKCRVINLMEILFLNVMGISYKL